MRTRTLVAASAAVLVITACTGPGATVPVAEPSSGDDADVTEAVEALPSAEPAYSPPMHVAEGVVPPTNRWYSALAFGEQANPAFAQPLMLTAREGGLVMSVPDVTASADAVTAQPGDSVQVHVDGAAGRPVVSRAGPVAVGLDALDADGTPLVEFAAAEGWPAIGLTAHAPARVLLSGPLEHDGEDGWALRAGGTTFAVRVAGGEVEGGSIDLQEGGTVTVAAVPDGTPAADIAATIGGPVDGVEIGFSLDDAVSTTLTYGSEQTVLAVPEDRIEGLECDLGSYASVQGTLHACRASALTWDVPAIEPTTSLDLEDITPDQREEIRSAVQADAAGPDQLPADSYFGAKALYRLATLADLADQLGEEQARHQLVARLSDELTTWTQVDGCEERAQRCFEYDATMHGMVGREAAFGSDEFNDHHFHYGYFLWAAATAVRFNPGLEDELAPVVDLVARDIASPHGSAAFPAVRVFDPYAGHSWASGTAPFAAGNNQESSSEAVLAWTAVSAWADVRADAELGDTARWMLALEAEAAERLWVYPDLSAFTEYSHDIVSLTWGGAREYSTWFSDEPSAKLGIQLIPMAPVQAHLALEDGEDASAITDRVNEAGQGAAGLPLTDYVLMYGALAGNEERERAWEAALALPEDSIDNASSRAYLLAWIAAAG